MINRLFSWFNNKPEIVEVHIEKPHYVFIHGANQSRVCWNYIIRELELGKDQYTCIEYSSLNAFAYNLEEMKSIIDTIPIPDERRFDSTRGAKLHARGRKHRRTSRSR